MRHTVLAAGEGYGTTDLAIKMCRPMPFNKKLIAEGKVINVGKNLVISEGYLRDEEGKLYAHATATNMIIRQNNQSKRRCKTFFFNFSNAIVRREIKRF